MSLLRYPRLYFAGEISWDPGVTNNSTTFFDAENVRLNLPAGMTLAQFKQNLPMTAAGGGSWNHFGTHRAVLEKVTVTGVSLDPALPVGTTDSLVGKPLAMAGKLVDLDAATVFGSQVFFDDLVIGDNTQGLRARRSRRLHARHINFGRNLGGLDIAGGAGVLWQTIFRKNDVQFNGAAGSPALAAWSAALQETEVAGLFVRFHTYRTLYFQNGIRNSTPQQPRNPTELRDLYAQGENFSNPAYSVVVGVIGLQLVGEPESAPAGRLLAPVDGPISAGPAFVEVDGPARRLVLDLGQTLPEQDADLAKIDAGPLEVKVRHEGGETVIATLAPANYSRASYEQTAGLVHLDLGNHPDAAIMQKISDGSLHVSCAPAGASQPLLRENPLVALVDERDLYLDEGESASVAIQVTQRGNQAPAGTTVKVFAYGRRLGNPADAGEFPVDGAGRGQFIVRAVVPGIRTYLFLPYLAGTQAPNPPQRINPLVDAFINVRTLPFDNALAQSTPDSTLTWTWIYENILGLYDALNPVMSRTSNPPINTPLSAQQQMEAMAGAIKAVTSKSRMESARFMPVTRDMSAGKRALLHRWCDLILSGHAPAPAIPPMFAQVEHLDDPRVAPPIA